MTVWDSPRQHPRDPMGWIHEWRARREAEDTVSLRTMPQEYPTFRAIILWAEVYQRLLAIALDVRARNGSMTISPDGARQIPSRFQLTGHRGTVSVAHRIDGERFTVLVDGASGSTAVPGPATDASPFEVEEWADEVGRTVLGAFGRHGP